MVRQTQRSKQCGKTLQEELLTNDHNENIIKNSNARTKILVCQTKRSKQWYDIARIPNCKEAEFDQCSCKDEDNGVPDTEEQAVVQYCKKN